MANISIAKKIDERVKSMLTHTPDKTTIIRRVVYKIAFEYAREYSASNKKINAFALAVSTKADAEYHNTRRMDISQNIVKIMRNECITFNLPIHM